MIREMPLCIQGLGFILYSPPAVRQIPEGADYLSSHFMRTADVARHVSEGQLTTFCTGSSGDFHLRLSYGILDDRALDAADFKLRLGLEVREGLVCIRDLYDLMQWHPDCPVEQQVTLADGWYRLTVWSSMPLSGALGDHQAVDVHFERCNARPSLRSRGIPSLYQKSG